MYSGTTLTSFSGRILGAHQRIDRAARHHIEKLLPGCKFPRTKYILHFEGGNGPDAIKRKSPAKDEPWHYIQPFDENDTALLKLIEDHYKNLIRALRDDNDVRAAFEAAWLAHAVVDGLTPAHHYPYEEKLVELRGGSGIEDRTSVRKKILMPGKNKRHQVANNWRYWGPKGLFITHSAFEWGVATLIAPLDLKSMTPSGEQVADFSQMDVKDWFRQIAQEVASLHLYDEFYKSGWTIPLARQVRTDLAPKLVQAVSLIWHGAAIEAHK